MTVTAVATSTGFQLSFTSVNSIILWLCWIMILRWVVIYYFIELLRENQRQTSVLQGFFFVLILHFIDGLHFWEKRRFQDK